MKYKNIGWEVGYAIPNAKKCKFLQKKGIGGQAIVEVYLCSDLKRYNF